MKNIHKQKLQQDLLMYSKQIGISDNELPTLVYNLTDFNKRLAQYGQQPHRRSKTTLGTVNYQSRTMMVNERLRGKDGFMWEYRRNSKSKKITVKRNGQEYYKMTRSKIGYLQYKKTLVHELVHYRFRQLNHGNKFERTIKEILRGIVFPKIVLYPNDTISEDNKSITPAIVEPVITIDYEGLYKALLQKHKKLLDNIRRIGLELEGYGSVPYV